MLSREDQLMLEMAKAYDKGISPYEFRRSFSDDINFIMDFNLAKNKKIKEKSERQEREEKINMVMESMRNGKCR